MILGEGSEVINGEVEKYFIIKCGWGDGWAKKGYARIRKELITRAWSVELQDKEFPLFHVEDEC